jgi:hypothetical protein
MRHVIAVLAAVVLVGLPSLAGAQATSSVEPFNLATVDIAGREAIALVLREQFVVEIHGANRNLETTGNYPVVTVPETMVALIGQYEYGLKHRIYEIVNHVIGKGQLTGARRPAYVHNVSDIRFLAPLRYPGKMMNAAVNFFSHACEACGPQERAAARAKRQANRGVPYLFYKTTRGAIIGHEDEVVLPSGRDRVDWEVELGVIIGRTARYVTADQAALCLRLHDSQRRLGSRRPSARRLRPGLGLAGRQGARHVRADGPVDRAGRVLRGSDEAPAHAAVDRRQAGAGGTDRGHDSQRLGADRIRVLDRDPAPG